MKIPDELKAGLPPNLWGKLLGATPVVMTVLATILAGLASSEMTSAQYDRSLAAQLQSKAGDQWGYFQAKRLRSTLQRNAFDLLASNGELNPLDVGAFQQVADKMPPQPEGAGTAPANAPLPALLASAEGKAVLDLLNRDDLPATGATPTLDHQIEAAIAAVEASAPEIEIARLVAPIEVAPLDRALVAARDRVQAFDAAMKPTEQVIAQIESSLARLRTSGDGSLKRDFTALRVRHAARRYDAEAGLNQAIANLYELQVRKSNVSAERHHLRSQRFFYGMLGAQMAVIIATFAMAARQRNLLWSLAAAAGLGAVVFALYVFLKV
jgi:Domain of unknown function (DUF4337)